MFKIEYFPGTNQLNSPMLKVWIQAARQPGFWHYSFSNRS